LYRGTTVLRIKVEGRELNSKFVAQNCSILLVFCEVYKQIYNEVTAKQQINGLIENMSNERKFIK